jgi:hypothetical protein
MFEVGDLHWHQTAIETIISALAGTEVPPAQNCAAEVMVAVRAEKARRQAVARSLWPANRDG